MNTKMSNVPPPPRLVVTTLKSVVADTSDGLCQLHLQHCAKDHSFKWGDVFAALPDKNLGQFWGAIHSHTARALRAMHVDGDSELVDPAMQRVLEAVTTMVEAALAYSVKTVDTPSVLIDTAAAAYDTALALHARLLNIPDEWPAVRDRICVICETWWALELFGREQLVTQTVASLLLASMTPGTGAGTRVKRLAAMRDALLLIDFGHASSAALKNALQKCFITTAYLSCVEGKRFLASLFRLDASLVSLLHSTIKSTLPYCPKPLLDDYGEVYYKAWRGCPPPLVATFETCCVQDLIDHAIHAQRRPGHSNMATVLRRVLDAFHAKKKERGVDEMLHRVYEPLLWRSLQVANPLVRANTVALLCAAFPLQDGTHSRAEADALIQRQFAALCEALVDPVPLVRSTGVEGVARILGLFWELIPPAVSTSLTAKLVSDMTRDAAAVSVRVSALKGLAYLLDNHLCQPLLKQLLPELKNVIHDTSDKVRLAMIDLLLVVKKIRDIKFWDIVPVDHLLARLEVDRRENAKRIVRLLDASYFPSQKSDAVRVERCVHMLRANRDASRQFYSLAHTIAADADVLKFVLALAAALQAALDVPAAPAAGLASSDFGAVLDVIAVCCGSIRKVLLRKSNKKAVATVATALSALFSRETLTREPGTTAAILQIAAYLPHDFMTTLSGKVLPALRTLSPTLATPAQYEPHIHSLVVAGQGDQVAVVVHEWLAAALQGLAPTPWPASTHAPQSPEDIAHRASLALKYLSAFLTASSTAMTTPASAACMEVLRVLEHVPALVVVGATGGSIPEATTPDFLLHALKLLYKVQLFVLAPRCDPAAEVGGNEDDDGDALLGAANGKGNVADSFCNSLEWVDVVVRAAASAASAALPAADQQPLQPQRKRKAGTVAVLPGAINTLPFVNAMLSAAADILAFGLHSVDYALRMQEMTASLLSSARGSAYLAGLGRLLCELNAVSTGTHDGPFPWDATVDDMLWAAIECAAAQGGASAQECLQTIRPVLVTLAKCRQRRRCLALFLAALSDRSVKLLAQSVEYESENLPAAITFVTSFASDTPLFARLLVGGLPLDHANPAFSLAAVTLARILAPCVHGDQAVVAGLHKALQAVLARQPAGEHGTSVHDAARETLVSLTVN